MASYEIHAPHAHRPTDHVELGPGVGADVEHRLLGDPAGKRVLVLGCGAGHDAVGLARRGARVTATDPSEEQVDAARAAAAREEVTVQFHVAEAADLAFEGADRVDLALSVHALAFVRELGRVFRQVHRVLHHAGHFVFSLPHPAALCADPVRREVTTRSWLQREPIGGRFVHRVEDVVTELRRANFEIDAVLERHADRDSLVPTTLMVRAGKLGT